jgi:hypothetical protein
VPGVTGPARLRFLFDDAMRARLTIAVLLMFPVIARANPVMIAGQSLMVFGMVAFWALVIESATAAHGRFS